MSHQPVATSSAAARRARVPDDRTLPIAGAAPRPKFDRGMLSLHALVVASAVALTAHWEPMLGAWPLLTVLACPLLHLIDYRD